MINVFFILQPNQITLMVHLSRHHQRLTLHVPHILLPHMLPWVLIQPPTQPLLIHHTHQRRREAADLRTISSLVPTSVLILLQMLLLVDQEVGIFSFFFLSSRNKPILEYQILLLIILIFPIKLYIIAYL